MKVRKKSKGFYITKLNDCYMSEISRDELVEEVSKLMELDEDELYARLGYQSSGLEERATELRLLDSFTIKKSDLAISGKAYFERHKQQLKEKICDDWEYCNKKKEYIKDFNSLIVVLLPIIATTASLPAPLMAVLCALAFKYGLDRLCECRT